LRKYAWICLGGVVLGLFVEHSAPLVGIPIAAVFGVLTVWLWVNSAMPKEDTTGSDPNETDR
jgi:hypothetical protein